MVISDKNNLRPCIIFGPLALPPSSRAAKRAVEPFASVALRGFEGWLEALASKIEASGFCSTHEELDGQSGVKICSYC